MTTVRRGHPPGRSQHSQAAHQIGVRPVWASQAIFFEAADYELYLSLVGEGRGRYGCSMHAYVLMTNHVHLLLTPDQIVI